MNPTKEAVPHSIWDFGKYHRILTLRLQVEAAALAGLDSPQAKSLAQERIEQAEDVQAMFEHFISL